MNSLIPVTLLTGFLGSGKTTILNHLMQQPQMADTLVIINEFGEIPLDHMLVAHSIENVIMEMSSGCLCCTIRSDLVKTLRDITWRFARNGQRQFQRVLIETTGLADPAPIIHTLLNDPQVAGRYRLDGIVTAIDMATGNQTLDAHVEAIKQAAVADCLLLTKMDLVIASDKQALLQRLDAINPAAPRWRVDRGCVDPSKLLNLGLFTTDGKVPDVARWLQEDAYASSLLHHDHHGHAHDVNRHDDHIQAFCFTMDNPISEDKLAAWLELLKGVVGSNILRVKGILNIQGQDNPVVIQGVQHVFHPPVSLPAWPSDDRRSRFVFITQDVARETIENLFRDFPPRM